MYTERKSKNILKIILLFIAMLLLSSLISKYTVINSKLNNSFATTKIIKNNKINFASTSNVEISFLFKIESNNHNLQNLFQTSNFNRGIRAEIGRNNDLWLLINDINNKLLGINITNNIKKNIFNKLLIQYSHGSIAVIFNDKIISNKFTTLAPKFDNIKFGVGFDNKRIFTGDIVETRVQSRHIKKTNYSFMILLLLLFIILLIVLNIIKSNSKLGNIYSIAECTTYNKNRYNNLLLLRSLAWLTVLVIHSYIIFGIKFENPINRLLINNIDFSFFVFPSPWSGVWMFFILSGFLMGKSFFSSRYQLSSKGIIQFYRNRVIQIFPMYIFSIIIVSIFLHPEIFKTSNLEYLFRLLTFSNDSELPININGALWSISTEIQFYILVPFLIIVIDFIVKKIGLRYVFLLVICLGIMERYTVYSFSGIDFVNWNKSIYKPLFSNLDLFLFGMLTNLFIDRILQTKYIIYFNYKTLFWIGLIALILFNSYVGYETFIIHNEILTKVFMFIMPTLTALFMVYLIVYIEINDILNNVLNIKMNLIHYFGVLTFPIYIWHEPILLQVNKILTLDSIFVFKVILGLLLIVIVAIMSYHFIEKPMGKMKYERK